MTLRTMFFSLLLALQAHPVSALALEVTRPVFVASVEKDSALLVWHTKEATISIVEYGTTMEYGLQSRSKLLTNIHETELFRLEPGQRYYYRVLTENETLFEGPEYYFETIPDKTTTQTRFLVWGDSGKGDAAQFALVPPMVAANAEFMLHTGDVIYTDGEAENFTPRYFEPYADFLRNTPVYAALGNHDIRTSDGQPYLDAFYLPENNPDGNERYYSFNWGQAHFVCMDSNDSIPQEELDWLRADMEAATTRWKFVYFHHPPYSCGLHGSNSYARSKFASLMEELDVDIVFTGHEHDYQRTHPMLDGSPIDVEQDPNYVDPRGVIYVVTGGGSTPRATYTHCEFTNVAISATHFTQVDIDGNRLTVNSIDTNGAALDTWTIEKTATAGAGMETAAKARLLPNVPNPFNPVTLLRYEMLTPHDMQLSIFDLRGHVVSKVTSGFRQAGTYQVMWSGRDQQGQPVPSGLYFARLQVGNDRLTRKILLAK